MPWEEMRCTGMVGLRVEMHGRGAVRDHVCVQVLFLKRNARAWSRTMLAAQTLEQIVLEMCISLDPETQQ